MLPRRPWDALGRHGASRGGPWTDFDSISGAPEALSGLILKRFPRTITITIDDDSTNMLRLAQTLSKPCQDLAKALAVPRTKDRVAFPLIIVIIITHAFETKITAFETKIRAFETELRGK